MVGRAHNADLQRSSCSQPRERDCARRSKKGSPSYCRQQKQRGKHHLVKDLMEEVSDPHRELHAVLRRSHPLLSRLARKAAGSLATPRDFTLVKTTVRSCKGLQGLLGERTVMSVKCLRAQ